MREATPRDVKDHVQRRFADVAANYRSSRVHAAGPDLERMLEADALPADALVLDAGCGAGHAALAFAPQARLVIACDFSTAMLDQTTVLVRERGVANVAPQLADVERLPFAPARFDLVTTRYSAHHWSQPERALAEFARLLKPGGSLLLSDIMASENYAQDTFLQTLELLRDPSHVRDFRMSEWRRMLAAAGFNCEVLLRFKLRLHFAAWTRRMATPQRNQGMLKDLFRGAPADLKRAFQLPEAILDDDFSFVIPGGVIRASR